jgi:hypothetical protein
MADPPFDALIVWKQSETIAHGRDCFRVRRASPLCHFGFAASGRAKKENAKAAMLAALQNSSVRTSYQTQ